MHIVNFRDCLPRAVQKWLKLLNWSRCSLRCWVGLVQGTYYMGVDAPWEGALLGCLTNWKGFWKFGKRMTCTKTSGPILTIYTSYDVFLRKQSPFGGHDICTCVKVFSGVSFLMAINSLTFWFDSPSLNFNHAEKEFHGSTVLYVILRDMNECYTVLPCCMVWIHSWLPSVWCVI